MKDKMTLDEYLQKLREKMGKMYYKIWDFSQIKKAYDEYCELKGNNAVDIVDRINLVNVTFFQKNNIENSYFSEFWMVLFDLNEYLLKRIPDNRFFKKKGEADAISNAMILPRLIENTGIKSAKYYLVDWIVDDSIQTYIDTFFITPNFLEKGDELFNLKDIVSSVEMDFGKIEVNLRKELELRHFDIENINSFIEEFRKDIFLNSFIENTDVSLNNISYIINNKKIRIAPMYDFDFCCGVESYVDKKIRINGSTELTSILEHYKNDKNFVKWIEEQILTLDIKSIVSENSTLPNRLNISENQMQYYIDYFEKRKSIVKDFFDKEKDANDTKKVQSINQNR